MKDPMLCEEVQKELANAAATGLSHAHDAHIADCPACRKARLLYTQIDELLMRTPMWEPPADFAERVVSRSIRPSSVRVNLRRGRPTAAAYLPANPLRQFALMLEGPFWVLRQYWSLTRGSFGLFVRR
jgi:hypothetical protein